MLAVGAVGLQRALCSPGRRYCTQVCVYDAISTWHNSCARPAAGAIGVYAAQGVGTVPALAPNTLCTALALSRSCSEFGIPMYITETGIADSRDDRRALMIDTYFKAVGKISCLFV